MVKSILTETNKLLFSPLAMKRVVKNYIDEILKSESEIISLDSVCEGDTSIITITLKNREYTNQRNI